MYVCIFLDKMYLFLFRFHMLIKTPCSSSLHILYVNLLLMSLVAILGPSPYVRVFIKRSSPRYIPFFILYSILKSSPKTELIISVSKYRIILYVFWLVFPCIYFYGSCGFLKSTNVRIYHWCYILSSSNALWIAGNSTISKAL